MSDAKDLVTLRTSPHQKKSIIVDRHFEDDFLRSTSWISSGYTTTFIYERNSNGERVAATEIKKAHVY